MKGITLCTSDVHFLVCHPHLKTVCLTNTDAHLGRQSYVHIHMDVCVLCASKCGDEPHGPFHIIPPRTAQGTSQTTHPPQVNLCMGECKCAWVHRCVGTCRLRSGQQRSAVLVRILVHPMLVWIRRGSSLPSSPLWQTRVILWLDSAKYA